MWRQIHRSTVKKDALVSTGMSFLLLLCLAWSFVDCLLDAEIWTHTPPATFPISNTCAVPGGDALFGSLSASP
jgi:hypothetical protein